ncbi:metallophosphoesterase [Negativicoccus succinicivorans]
MRFWALSDLHLSGDPPQKPMDVFGDRWRNHRQKVETNWRAQVAPEDTVLIGGDVSWAMKLEEAAPDLDFIRALPGRKIILRGNHDYWWAGLAKMQRATDHELLFLHNNFIPLTDAVAIAGTRGWIAPGDTQWKPEDEVVWARELQRLERSLTLAREACFTKLFVATHYPPFNEAREPTEMADIAKRYGALGYIYGHIHDEQNFRYLPREIHGMPLYLTSADYLQFHPLEIPLPM